MGPILLIDKSAIQFFSYDEVMALSKHYRFLICPILVKEIQGDLAKQPSRGNRNPLKAVCSLAGKAGGLSFTFDRWHPDLIRASLMGDIPLGPQIPRMDFEERRAPDGSLGIVLTETPDDIDLMRWAQGDFKDTDAIEAKDYLESRDGYGLHDSKLSLAKEFPENTKFKSLQELQQFAMDLADSGERCWPVIETCINSYRMGPEFLKKAYVRWLKLGKPSFSKFAPYAHYSHMVNSVFWIGVTAGLVPTGKGDKMVVDHQYLFYLPFCHAFCTNDIDQKKLASMFIRQNQFLVGGEELRLDIQKIMSCLENMNPDERKHYGIHFGGRPPPIPGSKTVDLWNDYAGPWQPFTGDLSLTRTPEENKKIAQEIIARFERSKPVEGN